MQITDSRVVTRFHHNDNQPYYIIIDLYNNVYISAEFC